MVLLIYSMAKIMKSANKGLKVLEKNFKQVRVILRIRLGNRFSPYFGTMMLNTLQLCLVLFYAKEEQFI